MSEFELNLLPLKVLVDQVDISFSRDAKDGYSRIFENELPKNFPHNEEQLAGGTIWWKPGRCSADIVVKVSLRENIRFAKHFFNGIIFDHFAGQGILTTKNFIRDTELYCEEPSVRHNDYKCFRKFSLRVDTNDIVDGNSLLLSYDGDSYILNKSLAEFPVDTSILGKIKYKNRVTKYRFLTHEEQADAVGIFPFLNRKIELEQGIRKPPRTFSENKYKKYYAQISSFYRDYLKDQVIGDSIEFFESGFVKPHERRIERIAEESNLLLFGNNKKHFTPYVGLKEYGPVASPRDRPVKMIFIFHGDDKSTANRLYSYFKKGYKSFPGLESFVGVQFDIDTSRSITFSRDNPMEEIRSACASLQFDTKKYNYVAIYLSRIKKDSPDETEDAVYFRLKELLLKIGVASQVIYKNNVDSPSFNYFLPNIAIALLAKLGGVPWRLYRPVKSDLVIGIGADRSDPTERKYVGCAFCFRNDGKFNGFNAFEKNDASALATALGTAIETFTEENAGIERLVIHYYKTMSAREEKPIQAVLNRLDLSIPYLIVTVNETESKDYVLFDSTFDGKMPQSGTFTKIKWNQFILCNNTRYSVATGTRLDGFPFPIKVSVRGGNSERNVDISVVRELIDQVYQFSRMYWKSVRQRNMPVTIEYSKIVAGMISHFENKELSDFARNSLWFL